MITKISWINKVIILIFLIGCSNENIIAIDEITVKPIGDPETINTLVPTIVTPFPTQFFLPTKEVVTINDDFISAVKNSDYEFLQEALNSGQTPNVIGSNGKSALLVATEKGDSFMVEWLLKHGADIDFFDPSYEIIDQTAFLFAGANGFDDILEILILYKPDVSIRNSYGGNALIPAAEKGHISTVKLLLEKTDMDVNFVNHLGWTALLEVVIFGRDNQTFQEIAGLLLLHGADISITDNDGVTPYEHARQRGLIRIAALLQKELEEN